MYNILVLFTHLNENLEKLIWGVVHCGKRVDTTTDATGEESAGSLERRKVLSKKTNKRKKSFAADELGRFFITGNGCCWEANSFLLQTLLQGCLCADNTWTVRDHSAFSGCSSLPAASTLSVVETTGRRALDFDERPLPDDEVDRQIDNILLASLVKRSMTMNVCPVRICWLTRVVQLNIFRQHSRGCPRWWMFFNSTSDYKHVGKFWGKFVLTTSRVDVDFFGRDLKWWLVRETQHSILVFPSRLLAHVWVNHLDWDVSPYSVLGCRLAECSPVKQCAVWRARSSVKGVPAHRGQEFLSTSACDGDGQVRQQCNQRAWHH